MMMSLGTCRLVMPLSEFTIARAGRFDHGDIRFDSRALISGNA
jgi:hypothetical protein